MRRKRLSAAAVAVLAAVLAASIAYVAGGGGNHQAAALAPASALDQFAVLKSAPAPTSADNPFLKSQILVATNHVDPATARRARVPGDVWVATGPNAICVLGHDEASSGVSHGGCAPAATVAAQGFFGGSHPAPAEIAAQGLSKGTTDIVAVLPDGVSAITVALGDGTTADVPVVDNVAAQRFAVEPISARFVDADGQQHVNPLTGS
jgi:hypothetical protein